MGFYLVLLGKNKATKGTKLGETIEKTGAFEKLQLYWDI